MPLPPHDTAASRRGAGGGRRPRVVVVGSGIAGLTAAVRAAAFADVTVVTKDALRESNTLYAQGGIAAALFGDDSPESHAADTLAAGAGLCDDEAVRILCTEGPALVRELVRFGVPFDLVGYGEGHAHGRDEDLAHLARGLEAAHSRARVLHAGGDATGRAIELTLAARLRASEVRVLEHTALTDLVVHDGRVLGVEVMDMGPSKAGAAGAIPAGGVPADGAPAGGAPVDAADAMTVRRRVLGAEAVILATGGAGRLFAHTTNPAVATGDGVAAAWRAGAELADLEFYQFHPTALGVPGGALVSEAVRGEGAVLVNQAGERFLRRVHPDAELAPRDVVARAIAAEMTRQGGAPVLLDATALGRAFLAARFPTIQAACRMAGFDWAREPIPVTPAAHYWMGGVRTDGWARASLPGLYAVGEVACTGAQGANRLASNSLLEGLVFAARATESLGAATSGAATPRWSPLDDELVLDAGVPKMAGGAHAADAATTFVRDTMWRLVGVARDGEGLREAVHLLDGVRSEQEQAEPPRDAAALEARTLATIGALMARSALAREESRGAHHRTDFPRSAPEPRHSVLVGGGHDDGEGDAPRFVPVLTRPALTSPGITSPVLTSPGITSPGITREAATAC
jgi:L-aspartate oxidase